MSQYYSEGNLIVRTDSFDLLVESVVEDILNEKEKVLKEKEEQEEQLSLWKDKVAQRLNSEKNLTKENFPELK